MELIDLPPESEVKRIVGSAHRRHQPLGVRSLQVNHREVAHGGLLVPHPLPVDTMPLIGRREIVVACSRQLFVKLVPSLELSW